MIDIEKIQGTWIEHEKKLEKSWKLNLELLRKVNVRSAQSKLTSLIWMNALTLIFYQAVLWFSVYFIAFHSTNMASFISGLTLIIWSGIISLGAVIQLKLILEIDYSAPVTIVQKHLQKVKIAIVHFIRMAFLILPVYIVFPVILFDILFDISLVHLMDPAWMIIQTLVLVFPTIWIYRNFSPKNVNKKWINWLLQGNGSQINEAQRFLNEIEVFEKS